MKKFYVGGSLFTSKQIEQRLREGKLLSGLDGVVVYNPIENDEINDKTGTPTPSDIFTQDTVEILASDVIFADLDDEDMGLAMELGIAFACNYFRNRIELGLETEDVRGALENLMANIPYKRVHATCSDIRQDTEGEEGIYKSWGQNMYVIGGVESMGMVHRNFEDAIACVIKQQEEE